MRRAVRVTGGDPDRLEIAASLAADARPRGLVLPVHLRPEHRRTARVSCRLRRTAAPTQRRGRVRHRRRTDPVHQGVPAQRNPRLNDFLGRAANVDRSRFGGKVTYASLPSEQVDWTPFDFVSADAYRSIEVADRYTDGIRALHTYIRDETEQATYLRELLDVFTTEGVDTAFWCTFAAYNLPHRDNARDDLDLASYGLVKVLEDRHGNTYPDLTWKPKAAFTALAVSTSSGLRSG